MRKVILQHVEVLNETEQFMLFLTTFNGQPYGASCIVNTALAIEHQDELIIKTIQALESMNRKDAKEST